MGLRWVYLEWTSKAKLVGIDTGHTKLWNGMAVSVTESDVYIVAQVDGRRF